MRKLVLAFCLIATICAYQQQKYNFNVVFDEIEFSNIPLDKYSLKYRTPINLPSSSIDILNKLAKKMEKENVGSTSAIVNDYADIIFENLDSLIIEKGFDPLSLPDMHSGFNYTFIITYHGELDLKSGLMADLSTIHRGGDVIVSYNSVDKYLEVTLPIAFDDLKFTYDYSAKIMGLGPTGGIEGNVNSLTIVVTLGFDVTALTASLDTFDITNSGHINFEFTGHPLIDWLLNLLTDVITTLLKKVILWVVENIIRGGLNGLVDIINKIINNIINPTTLAPTTTLASNFFIS